MCPQGMEHGGSAIYDPKTDDVGFVSLSAHVVTPDGDDPDFLLPAVSSRSGDYTYYTDNVFLCGFDSPGTYRAQTKYDAVKVKG